MTNQPRWLRDLLRFLPLKSQFVLTGNIRDLVAFDLGGGSVAPAPLLMALASELTARGYEAVLSYEPIGGFQLVQSMRGQAMRGRVEEANAVLTRLGLQPVNGCAAAGVDLLGQTLENLIATSGMPIALVVDYASRLVVRNDSLHVQEHMLYTRAQVLSNKALARPAGPNLTPFYNTVIWLADKEGDIPDWFLLNNPSVRHIPVAKPDRIARRSVAQPLLRAMPGAPAATADELNAASDAFVDQTEGLLLLEMRAIAELGRTEKVPFANISDAVRRYKVGVTEDPWKQIEHEKIAGADTFIRTRVKGQDHAITHVLDIMRRAVTGVGSSGRGGRPRGVVFLAGPTGVGKTELAKTVTSLLFGDESAYIRFDMSEFGAEHADQRLIGAPPGYLGYDMGGELTNAIREKPFSVVLFDEIEKAHPRILDKFLQILDDGVLTSGRGDRCYFSEAIIVFTSNLGIFRLDGRGARIQNVAPEDDYEVVRERVRSEIDRHFKVELNRPEILNRIGENIVVFDFIRPAVAEQIFEQLVRSTLSSLKAQGATIAISPSAYDALCALCTEDLSNGGRGIRNQIERHLMNPLSRSVFDAGGLEGLDAEIVAVIPGAATRLDLKFSERKAPAGYPA